MSFNEARMIQFMIVVRQPVWYYDYIIELGKLIPQLVFCITQSILQRWRAFK